MSSRAPLLLLLLPLLALPCCAPEREADGIVLILTDDQRHDTLWAMPAVLELAARGVRFRQSFVVTSLCGPSRATLLTGLRAEDHGVTENRPGAPLLDGQPTFVQELQLAGFRTGLFGKYLNGTDGLDAVPAGWTTFHAFHSDESNYFDYVVNEDGALVLHDDYSTDHMAARAVAFIQHARDLGEPWFVLFAPYAPHTDTTIDDLIAEGLPAFFRVTPAPRHEGAFAGFQHRPPSYRVPGVLPTHDSIWDAGGIADANDRLVQQQLESLLAVDEAVAQIVEAAGPDAAIVYTSDNGHMWGEHQLTGKNLAYDESIRVPLVVVVPGMEPGETSALVTNLDLAPTLLDLAGLEPSEALPGRSLVPLLADPALPWRGSFSGSHVAFPEGIFNVLFPMSSNTFTRSHTSKTIVHASGSFVGIEHFDLVADPYEMH